VSRLIHLNGPPGIGKSTLARRYADDHPGVLDCDIDVLRSLVGGWQQDFGRAGALIRPAALALVAAYLREGNDVVLPQLLTDPGQVARFESAATEAGARFVERMLMDSTGSAVARFHRRGGARPEDPWHAQVRAIVDAEGGDELLRAQHGALERLLPVRPDVVVIPSVEGQVEQTYDAFLASLG
jgi:predicted kinase